jgi:thioredoxin reductase (NADPH)
VSVAPDLKALADKVGLQTRAGLPFYDLIVIGSGPAGLAAAVYAGSEGLKCLVIEKTAPGGQAGSCPKIENYLGFPAGISGDDLARRAVSQAKRFGVEILSAQEVTQVSVKDGYRLVSLSDGTTISCHALLVATGASFRRLKVTGASALCGAGIYYGAAYTEAMNYTDQDVFVIGGANSAAQGALYLSRFARKVSILIRAQELTASSYLCEALSSSRKIEILRNSELIEVRGNGTLEQIIVHNTTTGKAQTLDASALFVFIGVEPQSGPVRDLVQCSSQGHILTGLDLIKEQRPPRGWPLERDPLFLETSVPGIFAAGDVRHGANPRVASAVGEGAMAYSLIKEYLKTL